MNTVTDQAQKAKDKWDDWMGSPCTKITAIVGAVIVAGVFTTATVYLGIYAYKNPDPLNCWITRDVFVPSLTKEEAINAVKGLDVEPIEGYPVEMHKIYLVWFLWGFWAKLVFAALIAATVGVCYASYNGGLIVASISVGLYAVNSIVWLIVGGIWRFSKGGMTAAGDRLVRPEGASDDEWNKQLESA